jgi:hypothetical protein
MQTERQHEHIQRTSFNAFTRSMAATGNRTVQPARNVVKSESSGRNTDSVKYCLFGSFMTVIDTPGLPGDMLCVILECFGRARAGRGGLRHAGFRQISCYRVKQHTIRRALTPAFSRTKFRRGTRSTFQVMTEIVCQPAQGVQKRWFIGNISARRPARGVALGGRARSRPRACVSSVLRNSGLISGGP